MRKLLILLFLFISTPSWAVDYEIPASGCTTDCSFDSVSSGGMVAERIDATTAVFEGQTTIGNLIVRRSGGTPGLNEGSLIYTGSRFIIANAAAAGDVRVQSVLDPFSGVSFRDFWALVSNGAGINGINFAQDDLICWNNTTTNNSTTLVSGDTCIVRDSANIFKITDGSTGLGGLATGSVLTAFRVLSSVSETITTADHTIFCLANDNVVTLNLPAVDTSTSQTLMIKYTDSGSTNKCKLDGNAAEQVEGFDVYSGLDTYKESTILKSDESAWWIMGGI